MNVDQWLLQDKYWQRKERPVNLQLTDLVTFRLTYWPCLCETCLSKPKRERKEKKFDKLGWSQIIYVVPGKFSTFFFGLPLRNSPNISRTFLFERRRGWGERDALLPPERTLSNFRRLSLRATSSKQPGVLLLSLNASLSQGYPRALFFLSVSFIHLFRASHCELKFLV